LSFMQKATWLVWAPSKYANSKILLLTFWLWRNIRTFAVQIFTSF
jgi:hypothetical protein